jgi:hypothetical protein
MNKLNAANNFVILYEKEESCIPPKIAIEWACMITIQQIPTSNIKSGIQQLIVRYNAK